MKTIEEAALHYGASMGDDPNKPRNGVYDGFITGVEFAQRWIPVEEELPDEGCDIICKDINNYKYIHRYYSFGFVDKDYLKKNYTHWRPIEYK